MSDNLMGLANELSINYQVILPDLVNHGQSPHRKAMSYPEMAGDVFKLMDSLGLGSVHLLGHSMGGKVAMQMATTAPMRVSSLVVVDIAPVKYPEKYHDIIRAMQKISSSVITARRQADAILAEVVNDDGLRGFFLKSLKRNEQGGWSWCYGLDEIEKAYSQICDAPQMGMPYLKPVLFIKGGNSDYIKEEDLQRAKVYFPQAILQVIPGAGHWPHAEKPMLLNQLVSKFLPAQNQDL